jgi:hypothetical protein
MDPTFAATTSPDGLRVTDPILQREYTLRTDRPVHPAERPSDGFYYPMDAACEITVADLVLPTTVATYVRTPEGEQVGEISNTHVESEPEAEYLVVLMTPIKVIVRFDSAFEVATADDRMAFSFPSETSVAVGARSYHDQPAGTITTTGAPEDLRAALGALASSLKTQSCERSWPTLRGHPPRIEVGDHLSIPDSFDPPETGVTITTPDDRGTLYAVAPLAFYLGATLEHGPETRLRTDAGLDHPLSLRETFENDPGSPDGPPRDVGRVLKQVVTLDCLTRTEGYYQVELHERDRFEREADASLDFPALYDESLAAQLDAYLSVPYADVEPVSPRWRLVSDVTPDAQSAELLPYIVNDLGIVRFARDRGDAKPPEPPVIDGFARGATDSSSDAGSTSDGFDRGPTEPASPEDSVAYVTPPDAHALEQAWAGPGRPFDAGKLLRAGFEHKFDHMAARGDDEGNGEQTAIEIAVVCNDGAMDAEYADRDLYGDRDEVRDDVSEFRDLSAARLRQVLESDRDFVHYIGHVEDGRFVCTDKYLDPEDLDSVGVSAFLLNGCRSYAAGVELVRSGAVGGIVTHSDVGNDAAVEIGRVTARLLNSGYSLRSALAISKDQRLVGNQYLVVGDGGNAIIQTVNGTPIAADIRKTDEGFEFLLETRATNDAGMGSLFTPYLPGVEEHYLSGGSIDTFKVTADDLASYLRLEEFPIEFGGEFYWSSEFNPYTV